MTTNPLLLERAGQACTVENLGELASLAHQPAPGKSRCRPGAPIRKRWWQRGNIWPELAVPGLRVVIKIPATAEGFQAAGSCVGRAGT